MEGYVEIVDLMGSIGKRPTERAKGVEPELEVLPKGVGANPVSEEDILHLWL